MTRRPFAHAVACRSSLVAQSRLRPFHKIGIKTRRRAQQVAAIMDASSPIQCAISFSEQQGINAHVLTLDPNVRGTDVELPSLRAQSIMFHGACPTINSEFLMVLRRTDGTARKLGSTCCTSESAEDWTSARLAPPSVDGPSWIGTSRR